MTIEAQLDKIIALLEAKAAPVPTKAAKVVKTAFAAAAPVAVDVPTAAVVAAAAAPAEQPTVTLDDVRAALVQAQTRLGSKAKPQEVLSKYSKTGTTGGLDKTDYSRVIAECTAL